MTRRLGHDMGKRSMELDQGSIMVLNRENQSFAMNNSQSFMMNNFHQSDSCTQEMRQVKENSEFLILFRVFDKSCSEYC